MNLLSVIRYMHEDSQHYTSEADAYAYAWFYKAGAYGEGCYQDADLRGSARRISQSLVQTYLAPARKDELNIPRRLILSVEYSRSILSSP